MKNNFVSLELSVKSRANESVPESFFYIYSGSDRNIGRSKKPIE